MKDQDYDSKTACCASSTTHFAQLGWWPCCRWIEGYCDSDTANVSGRLRLARAKRADMATENIPVAGHTSAPLERWALPVPHQSHQAAGSLSYRKDYPWNSRPLAQVRRNLQISSLIGLALVCWTDLLAFICRLLPDDTGDLLAFTASPEAGCRTSPWKTSTPQGPPSSRSIAHRSVSRANACRPGQQARMKMASAVEVDPAALPRSHREVAS